VDPPSGDAFFADLSSVLADGSSVARHIYVFNPGSSPLHLAARYLTAHGATAITMHVVRPHGLATIEAAKGLGATAGIGAVGGELAVSRGTSGTFIACCVGVSLDGRVVVEEPATPR
jgi:hypothetical protein